MEIIETIYIIDHYYWDGIKTAMMVLDECNSSKSIEISNVLSRSLSVNVHATQIARKLIKILPDNDLAEFKDLVKVEWLSASPVMDKLSANGGLIQKIIDSPENPVKLWKVQWTYFTYNPWEEENGNRNNI